MKMSSRSSRYVTSSRSNSRIKYNSAFEKILEQVKDPYWFQIFENCLNGKLPKKFVVQGDNLVFKRGVKIVDRIPIIYANDLIFFFRKHTGMSSKVNLENDQHDIDTIKDNIKSKYKIKQTTLHEYARILISKHDIKQQSWQDIVTLINIHIMNKNIKENTIEIDKNRITDIPGIYYNNGYIHCKYNIKQYSSDTYELRTPKLSNHDQIYKK